MVVLTRKHPTHVAHVAPMLRVGWATWAGCFPLSYPYYARVRVSLSTLQFKKYAEMLALSPFFCNFAFYEKGI